MEGTREKLKPLNGQHLVAHKIVDAGYQSRFGTIKMDIKNLVNII